MKKILCVVVLLPFFAAYAMTPEEAQDHIALQLKEARERSEQMQREKEEIIKKYKKIRDEEKRRNGPNYEDQQVYEQDQ